MTDRPTELIQQYEMLEDQINENSEKLKLKHGLRESSELRIKELIEIRGSAVNAGIELTFIKRPIRGLDESITILINEIEELSEKLKVEREELLELITTINEAGWYRERRFGLTLGKPEWIEFKN